jgi:hypothetical protein
VAKDGSEQTELVQGAVGSQIMGVAVDDDCVYFMVASEQSGVYAVPK